MIHRALYGPSELRAGWRLLLFLAMVIALISASGIVVERLFHGAGDAAVFLVRELMDFLIFLLASWIMGRIEGRSIAQYGLPWRRMFRLRFWQGLGLGFASITALLLVMRAAGVFRFGSMALHGREIGMWAIVYLLVFLLVALREEFRARGYGLFTLTAGLGFWPASILSAAFFGYSHHLNAGEDWIGLLNAGAFGLLLCFLLRRTGDLWMPIGVHMAFDWGETFFYGVANSGQSLPGHLLSSSSSGPYWLTGGNVGPEGSVLCTLIIAVVWLLCAAWLREIKYPFRGGRFGRLAIG
ncbi:MAG TPA: type II CAAX endopeptidase family protein [Terriglobales bacterium]|jgi:membrane protease YdiL (CAAX protease family)|nr:type II CAAX endopeptidase family protein [Terriglobales bacterium]